VRVLFPLALLVLSPVVATAAPALEGATAVRFQQTSDPNLVRLADGTVLTVIYAEGDWEKTGDWPEGKALTLGFDRDRGTLLVDPQGSFAVPVVDDLGERHPIAVADAACQQQNDSTMGMGGCLGETLERWDRQLNLNYRRLLGLLDADRQVPVKAAQRAWITWRDAQFAAITTVHQREGTVWGLVSTGRRIDLVREQAIRLGQLAAD
jgi:uncharacterized protein YecT (DUF1311 family)